MSELTSEKVKEMEKKGFGLRLYSINTDETICIYNGHKFHVKKRIPVHDDFFVEMVLI